MPKIDGEVAENLDILIGCLREMQRKLWGLPLEDHREAVKNMPELDVMEKTVDVLRQGNYEEARKTRSNAESKYLL